MNRHHRRYCFRMMIGWCLFQYALHTIFARAVSAQVKTTRCRVPLMPLPRTTGHLKMISPLSSAEYPPISACIVIWEGMVRNQSQFAEPPHLSLPPAESTAAAGVSGDETLRRVTKNVPGVLPLCSSICVPVWGSRPPRTTARTR